MKKVYLTALAAVLTGVLSFPEIAESKTSENNNQKIEIINKSKMNAYVEFSTNGSSISGFEVDKDENETMFVEGVEVKPNTLYTAKVADRRENINADGESCEIKTSSKVKNLAFIIRTSKSIKNLFKSKKILKCEFKETK